MLSIVHRPALGFCFPGQLLGLNLENIIRVIIIYHHNHSSHVRYPLIASSWLVLGIIQRATLGLHVPIQLLWLNLDEKRKLFRDRRKGTDQWAVLPSYHRLLACAWHCPKSHTSTAHSTQVYGFRSARKSTGERKLLSDTWTNRLTFLVPPPGLCLALSSDPHLDSAFHSNFLLSIWKEIIPVKQPLWDGWGLKYRNAAKASSNKMANDCTESWGSQEFSFFARVGFCISENKFWKQICRVSSFCTKHQNIVYYWYLFPTTARRVSHIVKRSNFWLHFPLKFMWFDLQEKPRKWVKFA